MINTFLRLEELADFHSHYLLGEDDNNSNALPTPKQSKNLLINQMDPSLNYEDEQWKEKLRKQYVKVWVPANRTYLS